jgi:hypothetical protein
MAFNPEKSASGDSADAQYKGTAPDELTTGTAPETLPTSAGPEKPFVQKYIFPIIGGTAAFAVAATMLGVTLFKKYKAPNTPGEEIVELEPNRLSTLYFAGEGLNFTFDEDLDGDGYRDPTEQGENFASLLGRASGKLYNHLPKDSSYTAPEGNPNVVFVTPEQQLLLESSGTPVISFDPESLQRAQEYVAGPDGKPGTGDDRDFTQDRLNSFALGALKMQAENLGLDLKESDLLNILDEALEEGKTEPSTGGSAASSTDPVTHSEPTFTLPPDSSTAASSAASTRPATSAASRTTAGTTAGTAASSSAKPTAKPNTTAKPETASPENKPWKDLRVGDRITLTADQIWSQDENVPMGWEQLMRTDLALGIDVNSKDDYVIIKLASPATDTDPRSDVNNKNSLTAITLKRDGNKYVVVKNPVTAYQKGDLASIVILPPNYESYISAGSRVSDSAWRLMSAQDDKHSWLCDRSGVYMDNPDVSYIFL